MILWILIVPVLQFLSGSIMYSYIIGRMVGVDLRKVRDKNPGASNLWRSAGWKMGVLALFLDYSKGTFPLFVFLQAGFVQNRYLISLAALCGILGHAFSPMLKFKGGKAVATTFGAWSVLTKWQAPVIMGSVLTFLYAVNPKSSVRTDGLKYISALLALSVYVLFKAFTANEWHLLVLYSGNLAVALYKHRDIFKK